MEDSSYTPLREDASRAFPIKTIPLPWSSLIVMLPHKLRRKLRSARSKLRTRASPSSSITSLQTSLSPADTLRALRAHHWSYYDGQYLLLAILGIFSLCIIQSPGPLVKFVVITLLFISLVLPITQQFFLPLLPIMSWLIYFYACQFINAEYRPPIWVKVLPALENVFYGANLSNVFSAHKSIALDILAWLPYGITHFGAPVVCSILMFIFGPPGTVPLFARSFGYMNLVGVTIQLLFPCSPPWYENMYGLAPANYSIPGSPAGLAAIDKLFHIDLYTSTFTASPMVFGAFPSLHSGSATIEALFMGNIFSRLRPLFVLYILWLWWATMYLSHHYAVDLVGGSILAGICYFIAKTKFLPRVQYDKTFRWDYDYIEVGEVEEKYAHALTVLEADFQRRSSGSDAWSLGSTSSISTTGDSSLTHGQRRSLDDPAALWDGETTASTTDSVT